MRVRWRRRGRPVAAAVCFYPTTFILLDSLLAVNVADSRLWPNYNLTHQCSTGSSASGLELEIDRGAQSLSTYKQRYLRYCRRVRSHVQ
jgi:hypothetical protein